MGAELSRDAAGVAVVRLTRPQAKNALDPLTLVELASIWDALRSNRDVRAIVLTGSGDSFCAGMDLKTTIPAAERLAAGERIPDEDFAGLKAARSATLQVDRPPQPIVAAVNGHCRGQGTDMLLATDYRIAVPEATFALEEVSLGLFPRGYTTVVLARQLPWPKAVELALSATPYWTARQALEAGLVNEIVEPSRLEERALEVAGRLASFDPDVVQSTLAALRSETFGEDSQSRILRSHEVADRLLRGRAARRQPRR